MSQTSMRIERRSDGWWVANVPDTIDACGPYDTRAEAAEDMRGLKYFFEVFQHTKPKKGPQS